MSMINPYARRQRIESAEQREYLGTAGEGNHRMRTPIVDVRDEDDEDSDKYEEKKSKPTLKHEKHSSHRHTRRYVKLPQFCPILLKSTETFLYHPKRRIPSSIFHEKAGTNQGIEIYIDAEYLTLQNSNVLHRHVFGGVDGFYSHDSDIVALLHHANIIPLTLEKQAVLKRGVWVRLSIHSPNDKYLDSCMAGGGVISRGTVLSGPRVKINGIDISPTGFIEDVSRRDGRGEERRGEERRGEGEEREREHFRKDSSFHLGANSLSIRYDNLFSFDESFEPLQVYNLSNLCGVPIGTPWPLSRSSPSGEGNEDIWGRRAEVISQNGRGEEREEREETDEKKERVKEEKEEKVKREEKRGEERRGEERGEEERKGEFIKGRWENIGERIQGESMYFSVFYFVQEMEDSDYCEGGIGEEWGAQSRQGEIFELCCDRLVALQEYLEANSHSVTDVCHTNSLFQIPTDLRQISFRFSRVLPHNEREMGEDEMKEEERRGEERKGERRGEIEELLAESYPLSAKKVQVLESGLHREDIEFGESTIWIRGRPYRRMVRSLSLPLTLTIEDADNRAEMILRGECSADSSARYRAELVPMVSVFDWDTRYPDPREAASDTLPKTTLKKKSRA